MVPLSRWGESRKCEKVCVCVCVCERERERETRDYEKVESVGDQKA